MPEEWLPVSRGEGGWGGGGEYVPKQWLPVSRSEGWGKCGC